ncbi:MAG TPA: peptidoglycan recognition family protein [Planctomycetota bacterium]|nr:peptidoglycan recognition family protein [Planctomycetota bacterium]
MDWLIDFLQGFSGEGAVPRGRRRGRLERVRQFLKRRRVKAKAAWKKFSKRLRRVLFAALCVVSLAALAFIAIVIYRLSKPKPSYDAALPAPAPPILPEFDEQVLAISPTVEKRHWKYIVIHHSGGVSGSAQAFDRQHREENHWRSLGYHFVIGNGHGQGDGIAVAGPRWYGQEAGAHAHSTEHNEFGIGICLVGNFDVQNPSAAEWHTLVALVRRLRTEYDIPTRNIFGHNQIRQGGSTACPGKNLNLQALREAVE